MAVMSMSLLYLTAWSPIKRTYQQSKIIPFSLSQECITNVESAMIQPVSSKYFYDYLFHDVADLKGVTLFALYADLRLFMVLCDKGDKAE